MHSMDTQWMTSFPQCMHIKTIAKYHSLMLYYNLKNWNKIGKLKKNQCYEKLHFQYIRKLLSRIKYLLIKLNAYPTLI